MCECEYLTRLCITRRHKQADKEKVFLIAYQQSRYQIVIVCYDDVRSFKYCK